MIEGRHVTPEPLDANRHTKGLFAASHVPDAIARQRGATEALYLFMAHVFDDLGGRRFEWQCNNADEPPKSAAPRFGFPFGGVFRQHIVAKGRNRDTAWFSILDGEGLRLKAGHLAWLDQGNFDAAGVQRRRLRPVSPASS